MSHISVNGTLYAVPEKLTLGQMADLEDICGQGYDMTQGGSKFMLGMAYICMREQNPELTIEEVRNLPIEMLEFDDEDPQPAADESAADPGINGSPSSEPSSAGPLGTSSVSTPVS